MDASANLSSFYTSFRADDTLIHIVPAFDYPPGHERGTHSSTTTTTTTTWMNHLFQSTLSTTNFGPYKAGIECIVPLWMAVVLQQRSFATILYPSWLSVSNLTSILQYEKNSTALFQTSRVGEDGGSNDKSSNMNYDDEDEEDAASASPSHMRKEQFLPDNYYEVATRLTAMVSSSSSSSQSNHAATTTATTHPIFDPNVEMNAPPMSSHPMSSGGYNNDTTNSVLTLLIQDVYEIRIDKLRQQFQTLIDDTTRNRNSTDLIINVTGIGTQELVSIQSFVQQAMNDLYHLSSSSVSSPPKV
jgi:GINS complex protein